jgi:hypothetical protein
MARTFEGGTISPISSIFDFPLDGKKDSSLAMLGKI